MVFHGLCSCVNPCLTLTLSPKGDYLNGFQSEGVIGTRFEFLRDKNINRKSKTVQMLRMVPMCVCVWACECMCVSVYVCVCLCMYLCVYVSVLVCEWAKTLGVEPMISCILNIRFPRHCFFFFTREGKLGFSITGHW